MKNWKFTAILILFLGALNVSNASACPTDREDYFCITPEMAPNSAVSLVDFYTIPAQIISLFTLEIKKTGFPVLLDAQWDSPYFGAGVSFYNDQYRLMILGGTTRIKGMSLDAYAAIVCHEIGHIIGGTPHQTISGAEWSSSEGQSDFFAANVCLPRYFKFKGEELKNISAKVEKSGFEMMWSLKDFDSNSSAQGKKIIRHLDKLPAASQTIINQYPSLQCRYENFRNPSKRPSCWFKE